MAYEGSQPLKSTFVAGEDLSAKQYHFVKMNGTLRQIVACSGATDEPIGVLQNDPASGEAAEVTIIGETKIKQSASIAPGTLIGTNNAGKADAKIWGTDVTEFIVGRMVMNGGADNTLGTAIVNCVTPVKAVTSA